MVVLIVEDRRAKATRVVSLIEGVVDSASLTIESVDSVFEAIRRLGESQYDLLVLDIILPMRSNGVPQDDGGIVLLDEILDGRGVRRPNHILCLTESDPAVEVLAKDRYRTLVSTLRFDEFGGDWEKLLLSRVAYLNDFLKQSALYPTEHSIDVAVVTSSVRVERVEVDASMNDYQVVFNERDEVAYSVGSWGGGEGSKRVVAASSSSMGMTASAVVVAKVVYRWRPRFLVMTGIAAGVEKDLTPGDVMVPEYVFDYGAGKISEGINGEEFFLPDYAQIPLDPVLLTKARALGEDISLWSAMIAGWNKRGGSSISTIPSLRVGPFASGAAVIQNHNVANRVQSHCRKLLGVDMEAFAVAFASQNLALPRPKVLIAKSVSDKGDALKSDDYQRFAAYTSAQFAREFFLRI